MQIKVNTDILPEPQKLLWPLLQDVPKDFVLYGGTAIALRYGHRQSVDFDFFTTKSFKLENIQKLDFIQKYSAHTVKQDDEFYDFFFGYGEYTFCKSNVSEYKPDNHAC